MNLSDRGLKETDAWKKAGIKLPRFDRAAMIAAAKAKPLWIHFGAGNIFRAYIAALQQQLLENGLSDRGIAAAFTLEPEVIDSIWKPCDNLTLSVTLNSNATIDKSVIGSVSETLYVDENSQDWPRAVEIFKNPSLQLVSFTITEKGYSSLESGAIYKAAQLLYKRFISNAAPIAVVSMDNCSKNGRLLKTSVLESVQRFGENYNKAAFIDYLTDEKRVSFPWTMIDKITPGPMPGVAAILKQDGFENADTIKTALGTFTSAFVNAERTQYLIIEDNFPNGRPPLETTGVIFTDRDTVNKVEKMKVGACLNPLHITLAVFGRLLNIESIPESIEDPSIRNLVEILGYDENLPMVVDPVIIRPADFLSECLNERFPNPFLKDACERIVTDTSKKLSPRFGDTIKSYLKKAPEKLRDLKVIPLTFAGYCRYLMGVDDAGQPINLSPDPLLAELTSYVSGIKLGKPANIHDALAPILSNSDIFGLNIEETDLGGVTEDYFAQMISKPGAVRELVDSFR
ncbi:MAG: mannitol dehydrogenase family protein [Clostridiales bacterium]|nr:mannitol dehydrogenase family protein [Clostridiales bacterium]